MNQHHQITILEREIIFLIYEEGVSIRKLGVTFILIHRPFNMS